MKSDETKGLPAPASPPLNPHKRVHVTLIASPSKRQRIGEKALPSFSQVWTEWCEGKYDPTTQSYGRKEIYTGEGILAASDVLRCIDHTLQAKAKNYLHNWNQEINDLLFTLPIRILVDAVALNPSLAKFGSNSGAGSGSSGDGADLTGNESKIELFDPADDKAKIVVQMAKEETKGKTEMLIRDVHGTIPQLKNIIMQVRTARHVAINTAEEVAKFVKGQPAFIDERIYLEALKLKVTIDTQVFLRLWQSTVFTIAGNKKPRREPLTGIIDPSLSMMQFLRINQRLYLFNGTIKANTVEAAFDIQTDNSLKLQLFYGTATDLLAVMILVERL